MGFWSKKWRNTNRIRPQPSKYLGVGNATIVVIFPGRLAIGFHSSNSEWNIQMKADNDKKQSLNCAKRQERGSHNL